MGKSLRIIILVTVTLYQLLAPVQSYAGVGQTLYPVILNAAINGGKMAGTVATRVIAGNPVLGVAMTSNPAGDASYDCMVAVNPACLPSPDGWPRDSTGNPTPPESTSSTPAKFPTKSDDARDDQYGPNSSWGQVYCRSSGWCWVWIKENDDGTTPSPPNGFNWVNRGSFFADGYPGPITNANKYTGNVSSPDLQGGCPPGYLQVGGSCIIKDPSVVKKTGVTCSIVRVGNTYSFDGTNPACDGAKNGQYQMADGNVYDASSGNVVIYPSWDDVKNKNPAATVSPTVDGGTQVKSYDKVSNTTTTTTIKDGKVVSSTTEAGNTTSNPPGTGTGTGTGGTPITCQQVGTCGVSQETTQQGVKTGVDKLVNLVTDMTKVDSSSPGKGDLPSNDTDFSLLSGMTMPSLSLDWLMKMFPDPQCTDIQLDMPMMSSTNSMTIPVCKYLPPIRNAMIWFWYGVTALTIMGMFLGTKPEDDK